MFKEPRNQGAKELRLKYTEQRENTTGLSQRGASI